MGWKLLVLMLPLGALCYWAGFAATARYRRNKQIFKVSGEEH